MSNHNHTVCKHANLKYCDHCRVPYCLDCGQEWKTYGWNGLYQYPTYTPTMPSLDYITYNTPFINSKDLSEFLCKHEEAK